MKILRYIPLCLALGLVVASCEREPAQPYPTTSNAGKANLKIVYAMPFVDGAPVQLKINDIRVSNNISYTTPFPGGGLNTGGGAYDQYIAINPGATTISVSVPKDESNVDSIPLYTGNLSLEADKHYTVYITDTAANATQFLVEENVTKPDLLTSRYKFVNIMPNSTALDLYFANEKVASNVPYLGTSTEFILPSDSSGKWSIRLAGAPDTDPAIYSYPTSVTGVNTVLRQRILSVYANGYIGGTGDAAPKVSLVYH